MTHFSEYLEIPRGVCAGMDAAARKRAELRDRLVNGKTVTVTKEGNAMSDGNGLNIPSGVLALCGDDELRKRLELKKKLLNGETVRVTNSGNAMSNNGDATVDVARGKLASQWYEQNPTLLTMEKIAMQRNFPQFTLDRLDDGRICWVGMLEPGIYESKYGVKRQYHLMAVYDNNHPNQQMGSSIRVYPLMPDVDELIQMAGFRPFHLLKDNVGNLYLCTNEASDQKVGRTTTTAASVLGWASKWLIAFELVLTGDLPAADFNRHGGI